MPPSRFARAYTFIMLKKIFKIYFNANVYGFFFIKTKIHFSCLRSKYTYNEDEVFLFLEAQGSFPGQSLLPVFLDILPGGF